MEETARIDRDSVAALKEAVDHVADLAQRTIDVSSPRPDNPRDTEAMTKLMQILSRITDAQEVAKTIDTETI